MKLRCAWVACLLVTGFPSLFSQTQRCHTTEYQTLVESQNPGFFQRRQAIDAHAAAHARDKATFGSRTGDGVITIPVVVHVLYNIPEENVSDDQVMSQIRILNEDFRRLNPDTVNTPVAFQSAAADTRIEFCLADIDPDGQPTTGITRTPTNNASFGLNNAIKFASTGGKDAWPRDQYMNMWVGDIAGGVLGYAQFPGGAPETDGIVVDYLYFGDIGTATPPFHLGRTATHEVGHWLNLRHIWGDGGCGVDDFVGDTPLAGAPNFDGFPCSFPGPNTCSTGPGDQADMFQNYMDYSEDLCFNLFTKDQSTRMEALFEPGGFREPLLSSNVCCPESACPRVSNFSAVAPDDASISLQWSGIDTAQAYFIEYKLQDSTTWVAEATITDSSYVITGLDICTQYEVRITTVCSNDSSTFCQLLQVETLGCCRAPEELTANDLTADSASLNWSNIFGANSYEVRYRLVGGNGTWTQFTSADTFLTISGLQSCQSYEFQVKPNCDTLGNDFSNSRQFFTGGCEACTEEDYCTPAANNTLVFIKRVEVGGIFTQATASDGGYGFFANTSE
ncbi:MAG: fibronectin type III domain-containing protein, partial [Bacteroidota bacterium]